MSRVFDHNGVWMFEPKPVAGNCVVRKATAAEIETHLEAEKPKKKAKKAKKKA